MPLNAIGWKTEEEEKLAELIEPHAFLYNALDPARNNILAREKTWQDIARTLSKPVEECKKRWRGLRDGYMRSKRVGAMHKTKVGMFEKLQFLDGVVMDSTEEVLGDTYEVVDERSIEEESVIGTEQQVITDNQEYYEITVVDGPQETHKPYIKILPKAEADEPPKKIRRNGGRRKAVPIPKNIPPIKILPKPILLNNINNGPKLVRYVEDPKTPVQKSQVIDQLIEKVLKENTNEIDVFFRSMAASVKKLQPNLIPKVKMEVCNVIAKYEMQSFDKQYAELLKTVPK